MIPLAAGVIGLSYLRRLLEPPAPSTTGVSTPYTPPFSGGQCPVLYNVRVSFVEISNGNRIPPYTAATVQAPVRSITAFNNVNGSSGIRITTDSGTASVSGNAGFYRDYEATLVRADGLPDDCGDIPNPNPSPPISSDGLASSSPIEPIDDSPLVTGAPLAVIPKLASVLAAIKAAVAGASNALDAIKNVMDAIDAIGNALDAINSLLKDRDRRDPEKKSLYVYTYGSIRKDGFLRLYPDENNTGFEPVFLDLQLLSIPIGYGRYFGNLSPNFYRFRSLGHISFVSSTLGIIETHSIEFSRMSLNVPDNAYGFFYHLGLDDVIRANVSLFYLQSEEVVEA